MKFKNLIAILAVISIVPSIIVGMEQRSYLGTLWSRIIGQDVYDFMDAAAHGNIDYVARELQRGVNVNAQNRRGDTALIFASRSGQYDMVRFLLDHNANPNIKNNFGGTALDDAKIFDHQDIVRLLIKAGAISADMREPK